MTRDHRPENLWTISVLRAQPSDHMLELGFGSGFAVQELAKVVTQGRICGVDFSKTMVSAARRRNADAIKSGRVDLRYGDVVALPFGDETFDKAYSIHSIYFWPQPLIALKEVQRVLKPGGILALTVLPKEKWNADGPDAPVGTPECKPYSGDELALMLAEAGFSSIHIQAESNQAHRSNFSVIGVKKE
jgi:ubiquinone/menaquinone biosynthesis C-methylase UbiE